MKDLRAFVLARIDEDEAAAMESDLHTARRHVGADLTPWALRTDVDASTMSGSGGQPPIRISAARVLAECAAKRRLVELAFEATGHDMTVDMERERGARESSGVPYVGDRIITALASAYVGHPDHPDHADHAEG